MKTTDHLSNFIFQTISVFVLIFSMLAITGCNTEEAPPDYSQYPWVARYGYNPEEVFTLKVSGKIPGPEIPVTVESDQHHCLIDMSQYDLILQESAYDLKKFEPQRIASHISGNQEMLLEEGYIHQISFLNQDYDLVYGKLLKRATHSIPSNGLIGRTFFLDKTLTFDLDQRLMAVSARALNLPSALADSVSRITINYRDAQERPLGLIKFKGVLNDTSLTMTLSTIHRYCQISPELAQQMGLKIRRGLVKLDSLQLGQYRFKKIRCAVNADQILLEPEWPQLIHFTVGLNIMEQALITFDFQHNQLLLE